MSDSGGQRSAPVPPWERGLPQTAGRVRRLRRSWIVLASVVAVLVATTGGVWAAGGFERDPIPYRGFKYGEKVVAGDVAVTVTEVALTDAVPGQDRDPAHDYLDVRATLRWNGDRGINAGGVAGALLGGALPTDHPDETARAGVLDADRNRLRTINPGMDYEVILYWPIRKGQQVIAVLLSVIEQIARDQDSRHAVTHSPREGDAVRVDLFKFKDLR